MELTREQQDFRDVVARFMSEQVPTSLIRRLMDDPLGHDAALWRRMSGELGLAGTHLPEAYGGDGFGAVELGIIQFEAGRTLCPSPLFGSAILAGYAILNAGSEADRRRLLPDIAAGERLAALVLDDLDDPTRVGRSISAREQGDTTRLSGSADAVLGGHCADLLIVAATGPAGVGLYELEARTRGVRVQPRRTIDMTRRFARIGLDDVPARPLGTPGRAGLETLWDQACTMLAMELVGGAVAQFESTLDYMRLRVQFGRAIASFQALKHRCADLLTQLELTRPVAVDATMRLGTDDWAGHEAHMAKAMAADTAMEIARQAIQLRGGIGFTWEEDTQLWFKRAKSSEVLFGTPDWHRDRMVRRLTENGTTPGVAA